MNKVFQESYGAGNWKDICVSPACVEASHAILSNLDASVDPCDNFYLFACGNFIKNTIIPDDRSTINIPHCIGQQVDAQLRTLLEQPISQSFDIIPFQLAKRLYRNCMNTVSIEKYELPNMLHHLKRLGGWPVVEGSKWDENAFEWTKTTFRLHKFGFGSSYLLRLYVFMDPKDSNKTVLFLHQALLGLKREYLSKGSTDKLVRAYFNYMVDVATVFGANRKRAQRELKESLKFEFMLAKISVPKEELRNFTKLYNPLTIAQLQETYPTIPWLLYINTLMNGVTVNASEIIIVQAPEYIEKLEQLLKITPKRVLANYLFWRVVESSVGFLNAKLRNRLLRYTTAVTGTTSLPPRWRECVSVVSYGMPLAIGSLYVRNYFDDASKKEAVQMVMNIRKELKQILTRIEWMDHSTKTRAIDKLNYMEAHVGYPDELLNNALLEQFYDKLNMSTIHYLDSILEITRFERLFEFKSLHAPVNKSGWVDHGYAAIVNAFYTFSENSINLPAGILQGAFFNSERPRYLNYGAIGSVIGHEIIHGYDDKGRQYDKNGNLVDWWAKMTEKLFISKAQCFIDQYSGYRDREVMMHLNGINTQGENIADNGGVKAAYDAYQRWLLDNGPEPKLPGLCYTPKQLFWLAYANAFCAKSRPEYTRLIITTDEHSPPMFRVIGSLSNLEEFSNDFECPPYSRMNPKQKCKLWS